MTTSVGSQPAPQLSKLELWEAGRKLLGYGEWDPESGEPYLKYAGMQAHRLWMSMRKRQATQEQFLICVEYCHRHHIRIENATWVFSHWRDARSEHQALTAVVGSQTSQLIEAAIQHERGLTDDLSASWQDRLARSLGNYREEVLTEWAHSRNVDLTTLLSPR